MATKYLVPLLALTAALAGHTAIAQSAGSPAGAIKPAATIACELKGTCGGLETGLGEGAATDVGNSEAADNPEAEVCRVDPQECTDPLAGRSDGDNVDTRGFSLRMAKSPATRAPTTRFAATTASRATSGTANYPANAAIVRPRTGPGRVNIGSVTRTRSLAESQKRGTASISSTRYVPGARSSLAVGFEYDSATLDAMGRAQATELLKVLTGKDFLGRRVIVAGHTDSLGDREYNLELSRRRAQTLVEFLSGNGVDRTLLEAKGFGFDDPLPGSSPRDGVNRRVEVMLKL